MKIANTIKIANKSAIFCCLSTVQFLGVALGASNASGVSGAAGDAKYANSMLIEATEKAGLHASVTNTLFDIYVEDVSTAYVLGGLLSLMNASNDVADIELHFRETMPVIATNFYAMDSKTLLHIYNHPEDDRAKGTVFLTIRFESLSNILEFVGYLDDWSGVLNYKIEEKEGHIKIIVGSPELIKPDEFHRRVYQIQQKYWEAFSKIGIPEKLKNGGNFTMAFDQNTGVLAIIDEKDSLLFLFAEALSDSVHISPHNHGESKTAFAEYKAASGWTYCLYGTPFASWKGKGGAVNWSGVSSEYVLGGLLAKIQTELPDLKMNLTIYKRDVNTAMRSGIEVINSAKLLNIYNNPENPKAKGDVEYEAAYVSVQGLLWHAYQLTGYLPISIPEATKENLQMKIGPAEVVSPERYARKIYQIPDDKLAFFREAGFPEKLDPTATITTAFDKDSGILAIIAPNDSHLFTFAEVLCNAVLSE